MAVNPVSARPTIPPARSAENPVSAVKGATVTAAAPGVAAVRDAVTVRLRAADDGAAGTSRLEEAVAQLRQKLDPDSTKLDFSVDDDLGRIVVKVLDRQTGEVIRQFPSEEMLKLAKSLDDVRGVLLRERA